MAMLSDILSLSKTVVRMSPYIMERRELLESRALRARYESLNGVQLYQAVVRRLGRIVRRQEKWRAEAAQRGEILHEARLAASALRAAPSGTADSPDLMAGAVDLRPKPLSMRKRKARSVQYLTNQKLLRQI